MPSYGIWLLPYISKTATLDPPSIIWTAYRIFYDVDRKFLRIGDGATAGGRIYRPSDGPVTTVTFTADVATYTVTIDDTLLDVDTSASSTGGTVLIGVALGTAQASQRVRITKVDSSSKALMVRATADGPLLGCLIEKGAVEFHSNGTAVVGG